MMLRKSELQSYIRSRKEGYPDDGAKLRGLIASNIVSIMDQVEDAIRRKQESRTEVEAMECDKDFARYQLALEENWKEFKHLFETDDCADEFKKTAKTPFDVKDEDTRDLIAAIASRVNSMRTHLVHLERDLHDLRSMYE